MRTSRLTLYRTQEELDSSELLRIDRETVGTALHEVIEVWEKDPTELGTNHKLISRELTGRKFVVDSVHPELDPTPPEFEYVIVYRPDDFSAIVLRRIDV